MYSTHVEHIISFNGFRVSILASLGTMRLFLDASLNIKSTDKCKGQCVDEEEESEE